MACLRTIRTGLAGGTAICGVGVDCIAESADLVRTVVFHVSGPVASETDYWTGGWAVWFNGTEVAAATAGLDWVRE